MESPIEPAQGETYPSKESLHLFPLTTLNFHPSLLSSDPPRTIVSFQLFGQSDDVAGKGWQAYSATVPALVFPDADISAPHFWAFPPDYLVISSVKGFSPLRCNLPLACHLWVVKIHDDGFETGSILVRRDKPGIRPEFFTANPASPFELRKNPMGQIW